MARSWQPSTVALGGIIVLTAINMRTAVGSVPPLLDEITADVPLSAAAAGLLTTFPVLCMAAGAPLAPVVARRIGHEAGLAIVALTIAAGIAARAPGSATALFAGTALAGFGMALGNILAPAIIKRDFRDQVGTVTGLYTMGMAASGGIAAASSVPIERALGTDWRLALAVWAVPALLVALVWTSLAAEGARTARRTPDPPKPSTALLRDRVAVQVTLFTGFQTLLFFSLLSWLPEMLRDAGISRASSGTLLSVMLFTSIPTCLAVPVLVGRRGDQRVAVCVTLATLTAGLVGLLVWRAQAALAWVTLIGLAQGSLLGLAYLFFAVRSRDAAGAGRLAAVAQTFGFLIAALGPLAVGALHDATGGWTVPLAFLLAAVLPALVYGLGAARNRFVAG